ncbi:hypothetical protein PCC7418_0064 [Halothece sp. PCC 7418]|nr:Rpn family recombination-promoting nuclease/putative transposase [Halothece sp. PCC 7418]AFZ42316.1 hypothetical protein PCC7418_0064 [Halothece sp. PCC 7418]
MKTDSLFYRLFQIRPQLLFELLSDSPQPASSYQFTSVEVKQLAFRLDGLFLPQNGDRNAPFYVVEVQFQPDEELYYRVFAELFLYLRQHQPPHPWRVVVIYPRRSVERLVEGQFEDLLNLNRVTRIYLEELETTESSAFGVRLVKLIIASEIEVSQQARSLLQQTQAEIMPSKLQDDIIDVIESIMVYKFPQKSRQEIATMLGVEDLKQTRFYQEVFAEGKQEGKQEAVSRMVASGVDLETIAQWLDLPLEIVREEAQKHQNSSS